MTVIYSGLNDLILEEQAVLKNIVEKEYPRIIRPIKNEADLLVKIKVIKKETRKRYIIILQLDAPTRRFIVKNRETENGGDWDIAKAAHKSMNALKTEVDHRLKTNSSSWKKGGIKKLMERFRL